MTKEKLASLNKYAISLKDGLSAKDVPVKHTNHPESYRAFLKHELDLVNRQLEEVRLAGLPTDKK